MNWYQPSWLFTEFAIAFGKVTLFLTTSWIIAFSLKKQSAVLRHRLWAAGILGALLLPPLAVVIPTHYARTFTRTAAHWAATAKSAPKPVSKVQLVTGFIDSRLFATQKPDYAVYMLALVWTAGFLFLLLRLLTAMVRLQDRAARSKPLTETDWQQAAAELGQRLGVVRSVRVLQYTDGMVMPSAWGLSRPAVLLPEQATEWSKERRRMVLAHEFAHISRHDWILQLCAELLCCIYWFHPLAWIAARKLRHESEQACDDAVLRLGIRPGDYARELLELAKILGNPGYGWSMALAVLHTSSLERRFAAMLTPTLDHGFLTSKAKWMIAVGALSLLLPLAALRLPAQGASEEGSAAPHGWFLAGTKPANYTAGVDRDAVFQGRPSAFLKAKPSAIEGFGTLMQSFSAEQYLGKRVRLSASVKSQQVNSWSGLWMRVDKGSVGVAFDNMMDRPIKGTTDWHTYSVVLDVPQDATAIFFGILLHEGGEVWLNSVQLETVGTEVPTTQNSLGGLPQPRAPKNLNFDE
jgi:beta-lactamase regulating signal transducer with metallopeptidase domain